LPLAAGDPAVTARPLSMALVALWSLSAGAQAPKPASPVVEKLGNNLYRVGGLQVDVARREITASGKVNDVVVLEFIANARDGVKAYESAVTLETDPVSFNAALLLIGLDPSRGRVPQYVIPVTRPDGDPVAIEIEWTRGSERRRVSADQLLYDAQKKAIMPVERWVYTGSTFTTDGQYMAELDGVLIGFMHTQSSIIDERGGAGVGRYGAIILNRNLGLEPNAPITLLVRALGSGKP
jgi:hypothetical protein